MIAAEASIYVIMPFHGYAPINCWQPRSQGLSSYRPGGKMRDSGNEVESREKTKFVGFCFHVKYV